MSVVFLGSELQGVDEDAHNQAVRLLASLLNEALVAGVQSPHGGDQTDDLGTAKRFQSLADFCDGLNQLGAHRGFFLSDA